MQPNPRESRGCAGEAFRLNRYLGRCFTIPGMDVERKTVTLELNDAAPGEFRAIFSTFGVVDRDGDVTLSDAFTKGQKVRIAQWGHNWGALPVGKGVITSDDSKAWVDGAFFLDTQAGADTYTTVKNLGNLQEWSFGYSVTKSKPGVFEGKDVRFLEALDVFEVSPVMLGAGINTRTEFVKSALSFDEESEHALAGVQEFSERAKALAALRGKDGRTLSEANRSRLRQHLETLSAMSVDIEELLTATEPPPKAAEANGVSEFARLQQVRAFIGAA